MQVKRREGYPNICVIEIPVIQRGWKNDSSIVTRNWKWTAEESYLGEPGGSRNLWEEYACVYVHFTACSYYINLKSLLSTRGNYITFYFKLNCFHSKRCLLTLVPLLLEPRLDFSQCLGILCWMTISVLELSTNTLSAFCRMSPAARGVWWNMHL